MRVGASLLKSVFHALTLLAAICIRCDAFLARSTAINSGRSFRADFAAKTKHGRDISLVVSNKANGKLNSPLSTVPHAKASVDERNDKPNFLRRIASTLSQTLNARAAEPSSLRSEWDRKRVQLQTLLRVGIPSALAGVVASMLFPAISLSLATALNDPGVFAVLSQDSSQFVQNFLTVAGLLFSILVGQTCEFFVKRSMNWRVGT